MSRLYSVHLATTNSSCPHVTTFRECHWYGCSNVGNESKADIHPHRFLCPTARPSAHKLDVHPPISNQPHKKSPHPFARVRPRACVGSLQSLRFARSGTDARARHGVYFVHSGAKARRSPRAHACVRAPARTCRCQLWQLPRSAGPSTMPCHALAERQGS